MAYADTNFFIALMNLDDALHEEAKKVYNKYKGNLQTSLLTILELLVGCEKRKLDPEIVSFRHEIGLVSD